MSSLTPGQIVDLLARGEETRLIATDESEQVDFKLAPYRLDEPHQKWELAKDVAAFANKRGGVIAVGIECERQQNEVIERATRIRRVRKNVVGLQQCRDVIDAWIYPRPQGIDIRWYPPEQTAIEGILVIEVPAQDQHLPPFIVRDMREPDAEFKGAVGIPRRDAERIIWDTAADIHRLITRGRSSVPTGGGGASGEALARAEARVNQTEREQGWANSPVYFLQAVPPRGPETLPGFYDEVRDELERRPVLRRSGFARRLRLHPEAVEGGWAMRTDESLIWAEPDGLLTQAVVAGDDTALGWYFNQSRKPEQPLTIHPVALLEVTLEFFRLLYGAIRPRVGVEGWRYRVLCKRFRAGNVTLPAGGIGEFPFYLGGSNSASSDDWLRLFEDTNDVDRDSFEALSRFYALFGHPPAAIPLSANGRVLEEQLLAMER
jgi:hypothetical protein